MRKLTLAVTALVLFAGFALAQTAKQPGNAKPKIKTVRLHIDGFQKSKSGAV
ncbi:MAG: hypothetical protein ABIU20_03420 [Blastocatellia bacterium]